MAPVRQMAVHGDGVEDGVAGPGAERLPAGMADVDGGREGIAEEDADHRADAVDEERGAGVELVAGRLGALEIQDRADDVEHRHGHEYGGVSPDAGVGQQAAEFVPRWARAGRSQMETSGHAGVGAICRPRSIHAAAVPATTAMKPVGRPSGQRTRPRVADEDQQRGKNRDEWRGEDLEDEAHRDEGDADAGQRGEQRGARRVPPHPRAEEGGGDLDDAAEQSGHERDAPGQVRIVGLAPDRPHDEEDEGEEADRVDAERQRGDGLAGLAREPPGLPRIEKISRHERDRDARQDAADHERLGQAGDGRAQADDDDELAEVVDEQAEEAVDVVGTNQPADAGRGGRSRHADCLAAGGWGREGNPGRIHLLPPLLNERSG